MPAFEGGILGELKKRKENREGETIRDSILASAQKNKMEEQKAAGVEPTGLSEDTISVFSKIKGSPREMISVAKDFGFIKPEETKPTAQRIQEVAKQNPGADVSGELAGGVKMSKKTPNVEDIQTEQRAIAEVGLETKAQEAFLDIKKEILKQGTNLDATEKQKLVFAEQGAKNVKIAQGLLSDDNFIQAVFQSAGGKIGKLSTAGNTQLRNYNTAVGSAIFSYVFANSGAQVSDKERKAFEEIYGLQIGDTLENGKFKNQLVAEFFETAKDIIDPNRVAGLSVSELSGKLNEIRSQLDQLGKGGTKEAQTIIEAMQKRALGEQPGDGSSGKKIGRFTVEVS